jgi:hypothetical protein
METQQRSTRLSCLFIRNNMSREVINFWHYQGKAWLQASSEDDYTCSARAENALFVTALIARFTPCQ